MKRSDFRPTNDKGTNLNARDRALIKENSRQNKVNNFENISNKDLDKLEQKQKAYDYRKSIDKKYQPTTDYEILEVRQNKATGSEYALIKDSKNSYYVVYLSSEDISQPLTKEQAEQDFNGYRNKSYSKESLSNSGIDKYPYNFNSKDDTEEYFLGKDPKKTKYYKDNVRKD